MTFLSLRVYHPLTISDLVNCKLRYTQPLTTSQQHAPLTSKIIRTKPIIMKMKN